MVPLSFLAIGALAARHQHVERQQNRRRRIDRHRRADFFERDLVEQALHVGEGGDRHAHFADFAGGQRMVGVHAHLGGQIEGYGESGGALREQVAIALVAFFGGAEAGVLAHGPEARSVHVPIDAAGVGELAGLFAFTRRLSS